MNWKALALAITLALYNAPQRGVVDALFSPHAVQRTTRLSSRRSSARQSPTMVGFFGGNRRTESPSELTSESDIRVNIERPSMNSRRISASIIIDRPLEDVWSILTDYDNLSTHVPNLVQSRLVDSPTGGLRLFQEGSQKIVGFDFSASLMMDMTESIDSSGSFPKRSIAFKLVESPFFSEFDGTWNLRVHSRKQVPGTNSFTYTTKLFYEVFIRPNGPVPVLALEWRIREDIPLNLIAVKRASEKLPLSDSAPAARTVRTVDWEAEETLGLYIKDGQ